MAFSFVICTYCNNKFLKDNRHINENNKLGHNFYCSLKCQYAFKDKKIELTCENPKCDNKFKRKRKDISPHNYCSTSCAAIVNNVKFPRKVVIRNCGYCDDRLLHYRKYCSTKCKSNALTISEEEVIDRIKDFYNKHGRIPVKREMWGIYQPARKYFGTWNNAIIVAGFKPNPIMFSDKCVAQDGHICDSVAEKVIDDYLYKKGIAHERNTCYPKGEYTFDFRIGSIFVEYFGLAGEHNRYDELRKIKQRIARKFNLHLIKIYPEDLYPHSKLEKILEGKF